MHVLVLGLVSIWEDRQQAVIMRLNGKLQKKVHGAIRAHSEGKRTQPVFGEGGFRDVCLKKVTF